MKKARIEDFLTPSQIRLAKRVRDKAVKDGRRVAHAIADEVIRPNMKEINRKLGQENDAVYLAYAVEYILSVME